MQQADLDLKLFRARRGAAASKPMQQGTKLERAIAPGAERAPSCQPLARPCEAWPGRISTATKQLTATQLETGRAEDGEQLEEIPPLDK